MCKFSAIKHLTKEDIIKNGCIFTSRNLVDLVFQQCEPHITEDTIILDMGSGYGAFINVFSKIGNRCIGTDCDEVSIELLRQDFPETEFFLENSLLNVCREKYGIGEEDRLIVVGNPPYNDTTSIYRKGQKGELVCDEDLISRDLGISFLKAYNKLKANYVCVLHPLSYLIKKQNFNQLKTFKDNYRLLKAVVFSSNMFESISKKSTDFPVVAALYERNTNGMTFEDILSFNFDIFDSDKKFCLGKIKTIDGIINKYPKKNASSNICFYTLRDINALARNTSFANGPISNGVDVTIDNLYQYAWLLFLKENFNPPEYKFLYGNLSPLYSLSIEEDAIKNILATYAYKKNKVVSSNFQKSEIEDKYGKIFEEENYFVLHEILNGLYI